MSVLILQCQVYRRQVSNIIKDGTHVAMIVTRFKHLLKFEIRWKISYPAVIVSNSIIYFHSA